MSESQDHFSGRIFLKIAVSALLNLLSIHEKVLTPFIFTKKKKPPLTGES